MQKGRLLSWIGLVGAVVLLLAINILSTVTFRQYRLDLTEDKLYTLSDGTRNIINSVEEPIHLTLYYSKGLASGAPSLRSHAQRVQEMLEEFSDRAGDKITLEVVDPAPFSEEEDEAVLNGLQGVPMTQAGDNFFLGLVGRNAIDQVQTIPFFDPQKDQFLEYDVAELVYNLSHPERKVLGVMSSLPFLGNVDAFDVLKSEAEREPPWIMATQLQQLFDVRKVETTATEIDDDIDVLMVIHPKDLSDQTLYAIDQFVLNGGRAMVFIDELSEMDRPPFDENNPYNSLWANRTSDLEPLLSTWGLSMEEEVVASDMKGAMRIPTRDESGRQQVVQYLPWFVSTKDTMNDKDVITAGLESVMVASAGILHKIDNTDLDITPLMTTSEESWRVPMNLVQFGPQPQNILDEFKASGEKFMIAARVSGIAKSAYPDGPPTEEGAEPTEEQMQKHVQKSDKPINVLVVSDSDILADDFWVQKQNMFGRQVIIPMAENFSFVANAAENFSGNSDLISVRSRGGFMRPFERVQELAKNAESKYREQVTELESKLKETEDRISEMQTQKEDAQSLVLSPEQQAEIEKFREERVRIRKELRKVQAELREDIEALNTRLKFINIGLIPLVVALIAVVLGLIRINRRRV
ncbi:Gldg family protein [bacterium]|nr:Gldg family protein [bacterium]